MWQSDCDLSPGRKVKKNRVDLREVAAWAGLEVAESSPCGGGVGGGRGCCPPAGPAVKG